MNLKKFLLLRDSNTMWFPKKWEQIWKISTAIHIIEILHIQKWGHIIQNDSWKLFSGIDKLSWVCFNQRLISLNIQPPVFNRHFYSVLIYLDTTYSEVDINLWIKLYDSYFTCGGRVESSKRNLPCVSASSQGLNVCSVATAERNGKTCSTAFLVPSSV